LCSVYVASCNAKTKGPWRKKTKEHDKTFHPIIRLAWSAIAEDRLSDDECSNTVQKNKKTFRRWPNVTPRIQSEALSTADAFMLLELTRVFAGATIVKLIAAPVGATARQFPPRDGAMAAK